MAYNNEKIQNLLAITDEIDPLMQKYLDGLKRRYEWSQSARAEYNRIRKDVTNIANELQRYSKKGQRVEDTLNNLALSVRNEASSLNDIYIDEVDTKGERGLEELSELRMSDFTVDYAETMHSYIKKNVPIKKGRLLALLRKRVNVKTIDTEKFEVAKKIGRQLEEVANEYLKKGYKHFSSSEFAANIAPIVRKLQANDFSEEASQLQQTNLMLPEEPERPNNQEIIEILHKARSPAMYISQGYTSPMFVRPVYKDMNYFQRALRENREYVGTENAYTRLKLSLSDLYEYYTAFYVQAGGTPRNYHGHYAGEKM